MTDMTSVGGETMTLKYNGLTQDERVDYIREPAQTPREFEAGFLAKCRLQWDVVPMQWTGSPGGFSLLEYVSGGHLIQIETPCLANYENGTVPGSDQSFEDQTVKAMRGAWRAHVPDTLL